MPTYGALTKNYIFFLIYVFPFCSLFSLLYFKANPKYFVFVIIVQYMILNMYTMPNIVSLAHTNHSAFLFNA